MKLTRKGWLLAVALTVASVIVYSRVCRAPHSGGVAGPTRGGRLVATLRGEPKSFNRLVSAGAPELLVTLLTQAPLVRVSRSTGELEPQLARKWTASPDGLTWTLELREGVTFSDGAPFTSADVLFTFAALYDSQVASPIASAMMVNDQPLAARALDDHTIVITFPAVYGPGLALLDGLPILPRHKLESALKAGAFVNAWNLSTAPADIVGLGPFVLAEYTSGQRLRFTRNPHYWQVDDRGEPLPYLDELEVQIASDQNAELLRLEAGETDLTNDFARPEDLGTLRAAEARGAIRLTEAGMAVDPSALWFNLTPGARAVADRPWMQREEFRKAISHAIDRQAIVNTVYLGAAEPIYGPITPGHGEWYVADLPKTELDPGKATALLGSIGLRDRDGNGTLEDTKGNPARFSIITQKGNTARERTTAMVQEQLRRVGLSVDVVALDRNALISQYLKSDYEAIYFGALTDSFDPARNLDFWMSYGSFHMWNPGQSKPATDWEAQIDDLMRKQSTTLDRAQRHTLFAEAQRVLAQHLPALFFAAPKATVAMSTRIRNATPSVLQPPVLWNAARIAVGPSTDGARR